MCIHYLIFFSQCVDQDNDTPTYPVFYKVPVAASDDIKKGDHLVCKSSHYLIQKVVAPDRFDAYTSQRSRCVLKIGVRLREGAYKVDYNGFENKTIEESLKIAKKKKLCKTSKCSCEFVTEMKCGIALYINEKCLIDKDIHIESHTKVSPHITVDIGDHLAIKPPNSCEFYSALVYKCIDKCKFLIIPRLPETDSDEIDLSPLKFTGEAYRMNYSQSLPSDEVLIRARCKTGMQIIDQKESSLHVRWNYVTQAKAGKTIDIADISRMDKEDGFISLQSNIHRCYERIFSLSDLKTGDHIFINCGLKKIIVVYRKHMLVTECKKNSTTFKVAFCLRTYVEEKEIDLEDCDVYRIQYFEELPSVRAIERARGEVGKRNFQPLARMSFVTWAKTGFDSVEVSLLQYDSAPQSKSMISSFTQLNPGDYLAKRNRYGYSHHYIVLSVESPNECTVCESTLTRKVKKENLTCKWDEETPTYYRINYRENVCFQRKRSVEHAKVLLGSRDLTLMHGLSRKRFVHYLKTGERSPVDIDELEDDHFMSLGMERIISMSVVARGDHVCRPIGKKILRLAGATHHMLIDELCTTEKQSVKVLHFQVSGERCHQKGAVVNEELDFSELNELYRIQYPDRIEPNEAIAKLKYSIETNEKVILILL